MTASDFVSGIENQLFMEATSEVGYSYITLKIQFEKSVYLFIYFFFLSFK